MLIAHGQGGPQLYPIWAIIDQHTGRPYGTPFSATEPQLDAQKYIKNFVLKAMKPKIKGPIIAGNEAHKKAAFKQGDCNNEVMI